MVRPSLEWFLFCMGRSAFTEALVEFFSLSPSQHAGLLLSEPKLWSANVIGLTLSIYYFFSYARLTQPGAVSLPGTLQQHLQGVATILASVLWQAKQRNSNTLGRLGVAINMALYASPLAAIQTVLETQSSKSIPFPMTLATLVSCIFWAITGLLDMKDPYVWFPSIVGLAFALVQVGLKLVFRENGAVGIHQIPELTSKKMVLK